jgi:hypothetical protein
MMAVENIHQASYGIFQRNKPSTGRVIFKENLLSSSLC